jgi:hypothetical protein
MREAYDIARQHGVEIPDYVEFHVLPKGYPMAVNQFAKTTEFREFDGTVIQWDKFLNQRGKVPFLVKPDVMTSDEAIVAVFGHEVFEIECLRRRFDSNAPIEAWEAETCPNNEGNTHSQAWDYANSLVARMRGVA